MVSPTAAAGRSRPEAGRGQMPADGSLAPCQRVPVPLARWAVPVGPDSLVGVYDDLMAWAWADGQANLGPLLEVVPQGGGKGSHAKVSVPPRDGLLCDCDSNLARQPPPALRDVAAKLGQISVVHQFHIGAAMDCLGVELQFLGSSCCVSV